MARFFYYWEIISRVCPAEKAGPAIRCIFIFLKKENKGCRYYPSHGILFIKVILVQIAIFET